MHDAGFPGPPRLTQAMSGGNVKDVTHPLTVAVLTAAAAATQNQGTAESYGSGNEWQ